MLKFTALLLIIAGLVLLPDQAPAESDHTLCAAVLPCDLFGGVLPQFSNPSSPCFKGYARQCAAHATRINLLDEYAADLARQLARVRLSNRLLRRENRRLSSSAGRPRI